MMTAMEFGTRSLDELAVTFPEAMLERGHLSASSLKTLMRCPETFRRRYLLGEKERPAGNLLWGTADHAAIEFNFRHKLDSYEDKPIGEVREVFVDELETRVEEAGGVHEVDWGKDATTKAGRKKALASAIDTGALGVEAYRTDVAPLWQPVAIEEEFTVQIDHVPVKLLGYIDLVAHEVDPITREIVKPGPPTAIDRKTSAQRKKKPDQEWVFQGRIYQLHRTKSPVEFHVTAKNKQPVVDHGTSDLRIKPWPQKRTKLMVRQLVSQLTFLQQRFGPDHPWPGAWTHPWACGYCGYKRTCFWHGGKGTTAVSA